MLSGFRDFICWCGGANLSILNQCPEEKTKFESIGAGVLITALMSGIAITFALYSLFTEDFYLKDLKLCSFIFFWAIIIFSIDWSLVKTLHKKSRRSWGEWLGFIFGIVFRFFVAGIIAFTVSKPLEVQLFKSVLEGQILIDGQGQAKQVENELIAQDQRDSASTASASKARKDAQALVDGGCTSADCQQLRQRIQKIEAELSIIYTRRNEAMKNLNFLYVRADCIFRDTSGAAVKGKLNGSCQDEAARYRSAINRQNELAAPLVGEKRDKSRELTDKKNDWNRLYGKELENARATEDLEKESQRTNVEKKKEVMQQVNTVRQQYKPNLMTYIGATYNLGEREDGKYITFVSWLLFFIFLLIDTAPIVIKLLMKRGAYEEIAERMEYERRVQQDQLRFLAEQEREANQGLVHDISVMQRNLIREAMRAYTKDEAANMQERYKTYFSAENVEDNGNPRTND